MNLEFPGVQAGFRKGRTKDQIANICWTIEKASLVAQLVKNPPALQETPVQFLGQEDLLEKG